MREDTQQKREAVASLFLLYGKVSWTRTLSRRTVSGCFFAKSGPLGAGVLAQLFEEANS